MNNFFTSLIRTYVPIAIGALFAWFTTRGLILDPEAQASAVIFLTGLSQALYYAVIRFLEIKFPQIGWFLGLAKAPGYAVGDPPAASPGRNKDLGAVSAYTLAWIALAVGVIGILLYLFGSPADL